jgi:hypothetical protein
MLSTKSTTFGRILSFRLVGRKGTTIEVDIYRTGIWVHGWIFHVETGLIEDTILENHMP